MSKKEEYKVKKFLAVLLTVLMSISLVACGGDTTGDDTQGEDETQTVKMGLGVSSTVSGNGVDADHESGKFEQDATYALVVFDAEGKINKVEFLSISETPGLGMQAKTKPEHLEQYVGVASDNFTVVKDGSGNLKKDVADKTENIDSLSGSTITSKSVNNGINAAVVTAKTVYSTPGLKTVGGVPIG